MGSLKRTLGVALALSLAPLAVAHVRLLNPSNGNPLFWPVPGNISIVVNSTGSDDIADDSDEVAVRMAIADWNAVSGTNSLFVENTDPVQQARTDWDSDSVHLVWFDETNSSSFFPGGSGIVAVTPLLFFSNGQIADADILYNGNEFQFTTSAQGGRFDVQDVGAHELGHLLGLNHSGIAGSTLYPYVDPSTVLHRSLSEDDVRGLRDAYPAGGPGAFGRITGTVERAADSSAIAGAYVTATDADGRSQAAGLTNIAGAFTLFGLDPGTYTVQASPLDSPVSVANLGMGYIVQTDFEPGTFGSTAVITATENVALGTLSVDADVALNLGDNTDVFPVRVVAGATTNVTLRGTGLAIGSTLTASDPDFTIAGEIWAGSLVSFQVTVPGGEERGHVDLTVTNASGDVTLLPAALEVTPPSPTVGSIAPTTGSSFGGTDVTVTGTGFLPGARVVLGDRFYTDGVDAVVVDPTTITLTTDPTAQGTHDVVVLDPSGVEGRLPGGFAAQPLPTLTTAFPMAGDALGGTPVTLTGSNFQAGLEVRLDGVTQTGVVLEGTTKVTFTTSAGAPNPGALLEVENPDGGLASLAFSYVAQPDPTLTTLDPAVGGNAGGTTITLSGSDFTADTMVFFGADPDTGAGGTAAAMVTLIDPSTLEVVTPNHGPGLASVHVQDASTGQASLLAAAFNFTAPPGGGGGCYVRPGASGPGGPRQVLLGSWWTALLAAFLLWRARRPRRAARSSA